MKYLLVCAVAVLMVTQANAQREGGAFWGPFAHGNSSGGNFSPSMTCSSISAADRARCSRSVAVKQAAKKPRR
jgi:hypothetical protein